MHRGRGVYFDENNNNIRTFSFGFLFFGNESFVLHILAIEGCLANVVVVGVMYSIHGTNEPSFDEGYKICDIFPTSPSTFPFQFMCFFCSQGKTCLVSKKMQIFSILRGVEMENFRYVYMKVRMSVRPSGSLPM